MYNEQLESLINVALADGELTEKEKQILFKKAQSMGIDLNEFEMVLDARLVELKKVENAKTESVTPKSNKLGDVKKCPACGAMVQSYQGVCPECGYAFEGLEANSSYQNLAELLDRIMVENNALEQKEIMSPYDSRQRIVNAIQNFPIPNTKADLFEFITSLQANISGEYRRAYERKIEACILKAKSLFPNDKMITELINKYETDSLNRKRKRKKILMIGIPIFIVIITVGIIIWIISDKKNKLRSDYDVVKTEVQVLLQKNKSKEAEQLVMDYEGSSSSSSIEDARRYIIKKYIDNNQIEQAIRAFKKFENKFGSYYNLNSGGKDLRTYFIKQHKYKEALDYVNKDSEWDYEEYVKECLHEMCKNGEKAQAVEFAKKNVGFIEGVNGKEAQMKKLNQIINSY